MYYKYDMLFDLTIENNCYNFECPLKKFIKDSFQDLYLFICRRLYVLCFISFCSFVRGSNGISPNFPTTFFTFKA